MKAYFLSDIHVANSHEERYQKLIRFLVQITADKECSHVFFLGDIFDMWIGNHNYFKDKFSELVRAMEELVQSGKEVHYFEGNHDLYLREFWQDSLGINVHSEPAYFRLGDFTVRLEHGDQMDLTDRGYLFLRWFLRTPVLKFAARKLPEKLVSEIGERASRASRVYTSESKVISNERAVLNIRGHAQNAYAERRFDWIISGHVHVRDYFEFQRDGNRVRSINLGSWFKDAKVFMISESQQEFVDVK